MQGEGFAAFRDMVDKGRLGPGTIIMAGEPPYGMSYKVLPPEKRGKHDFYPLQRVVDDSDPLPRYIFSPINARDVLKGMLWYMMD